MGGVDAVGALGGCPGEGLVAVSGAVLVPVGLLRPGFSPRLLGEDIEHVQRLVESTALLPPIVVHRVSMRVVDGMHRLRAAVVRGEEEVWVEYFDGDEAMAFVVAVRKNIAHGLPLTAADRAAAVRHIIESQPTWSDRAIAAATGLSGKTVAVVRRRSTEESARSNVRLGLDGRVRPLDFSVGRLRASEIIARDPDASLRAIARGAAVSLATARDVRERLRNGQDPLPGKRRAGHQQQGRQQGAGSGRADRAAGQGTEQMGRLATSPTANSPMDISVLRRDPSLRFNETGRLLLRLLETHATAGGRWEQLVDTVPQHCLPTVTVLASALADRWAQFAQRLDSRRKAQPG